MNDHLKFVRPIDYTSFKDNNKYEFCPDCKKNPLLQGHKTCFPCQKNIDRTTTCYSCELCTADRKYIADTDNVFELIGYDYINWAEIWYCHRCKVGIHIEIMESSLVRDMIHVKARKEHIDSVCDGITSGRISF